MNEWVSVEERLPEKEETVLIFAYVGFNYKNYPRPTKIYTAYWSDDYGFRWEPDCDCSGYERDTERIEAIYWMPLPLPPKE